MKDSEKYSSHCLNVASFSEVSLVNGPGRRAVVWVQGCPFRCPGCWNPDFLSFRPKTLVTVEVLADKILELRRLDGVTYSGGEPFAQANGLAYLGEILQANGLSIVCFTGYRLDEVRAANRLDWNRLLSVTDLLVDGPYMRDRKTTMPLRGSSNQRIHFLTRRFVDHPELKENTAKRFEIHLTTEGKMQVTGFPEFDLGELQKRLRSHGICVR